LFLRDTDVDKSIITFHSAVGMKMPISPRQINNVLRVYGEQLCQSRIFDQPEANDANEPDRISFPAKTKQKSIIDDITSNIIERITKTGPHDNIEKEIFKKLECEHEKLLAMNKCRHIIIIFKKIDENAETINSLSIEDSKFKTNKLMVITKESAEKNMK
jgi:hypothetical protein